MFTVSVETTFSASHQLRLEDGRQEDFHSHDWHVTAAVCSDRLNSLGLVVDFYWLKACLEEVTGVLGGIKLSQLEYFRRNNPSAEMVARYIYEKLEEKTADTVKIESVTVVEEPGCTAKFGK